MLSQVYKSVSFAGYRINTQFVDHRDTHESDIETHYLIGFIGLTAGLIAGLCVFNRLCKDEIKCKEFNLEKHNLTALHERQLVIHKQIRQTNEFFFDWLLKLNTITNTLHYTLTNNDLKKLEKDLHHINNIIANIISSHETMPKIETMQHLEQEIDNLYNKNIQSDRQQFTPLYKRMPYINVLIAASTGLATAYVSDMAQSYILGKNPDSSEKIFTLVTVALSALASAIAGYVQVDTLSTNIHSSEVKRIMISDAIFNSNDESLPDIKSYRKRNLQLKKLIDDLLVIFKSHHCAKLTESINNKIENIVLKEQKISSYYNELNIFVEAIEDKYSTRSIELNVENELIEVKSEDSSLFTKNVHSYQTFSPK